MTITRAAALVLALAATQALSGAIAQDKRPALKVLSAPEDATQKTVLVGRNLAGAMIIQLELEPAKGMWMQMGNPSTWMEHPVGTGELFHVEVKPIDPKSKTRISYAAVKFAAVNRDNGRKVDGMLHPMWGGSGLHYAMNSGLAGDGTYEATVTVDPPTFARDLKDKGRWMRPTSTTFHFRLADGKLTEVSEPMD
jgi:uncharacterized protein involved in high-affinity Fe2+ transport